MNTKTELAHDVYHINRQPLAVSLYTDILTSNTEYPYCLTISADVRARSIKTIITVLFPTCKRTVLNVLLYLRSKAQHAANNALQRAPKH